MWEQVSKTSRRLKARKLFSYGLTALVAVFLSLFILIPSSSAADATWRNQSIVYEGKEYIGPTIVKENEIPQLPAGSTYYTYVETVSDRPLVQRAHVLYFPTGLDPGAEKSVKYIQYDLEGRTFSNPNNSKDISIEVSTTSAEEVSSCSVSGIGWIICPVSNFLASGMDWVFSVLRTFIEVEPLNLSTSDPSNGLFAAWNIMRGLANTAFIIAFLIIIYSQITNYGSSNYSIKKMLPRLIIAAVLVNVSYYICAVAVDLSNLLGVGFQQLFMDIRESVFRIDDSWNGDNLTWQNVTSAVLGGSVTGLAAAVGIGSLVAASGGSIAGMVFLVLPALLGLFLTVLLVLLILAARQALIVILIVIAPLAFVASLLPNTEKWYDKWKSTFMTMLIFFPAFSIVFGGSQLAGSIIIQNANSLLMVVLGMIVQVAPLVITPFLLKFSGSLLGKVAGIVNNPRKGLLDRTRSFAGLKAEDHKYRNIAKPMNRNNFLARAGRNMEYRKRQSTRRTELNKQRFSGYEARRRYSNPRDQQLEIDTRNAKAQTKNYEDAFDTAYEEMRAGNGSSMQGMRRDLTRSESIIDSVRTRSGRDTIRTISQAAIDNTVSIDHEARILASAKSSAQNIQIQSYANLVRDNQEVRIRAGGIDVENGSNRAWANALAAIDRARKEARSNIKIILTELNPTRDELLGVAMGSSQMIHNTAETRAAALEVIFGGKDKGAIANAYETVDLSFNDIQDSEERQMLRIITGEAMMMGARAPWVGGGTVAKLKQGSAWDGSVLSGPYGESGVDAAVIRSIKDSVIDPRTLADMGTGYLAQLTRAVTSRRSELDPEDLARLTNAVQEVLNPANPLSQQLGDSEPVLRNLLNIL